MKALTITEAKVAGEDQHIVLSHEALADALKKGEVEAVFKFAVLPRDEPDQAVKTIHNIEGPFLNKERPTASSVISTSNEDRDGDIVRSEGIILTENYFKNPIVLPGHAYDFPVGFTQQIKQTKSRIWAKWQWLVDMDQTQAEAYRKLWDAHVLNCTSIGFLPMEWEEWRGENPHFSPFGGLDFKEWELLEHSPVVIPSNREAMRTDDVKEVLNGYAEAVMAGCSPVAKSLFEEALAKDRPKQVAVGNAAIKLDIDASEAMRKLDDLENKMATISRGGKPGEGFAQVRIPVDIKGTLPFTKLSEDTSTDSDGNTTTIVTVEDVETASDQPEVKSVIPYKETPKAPEDEEWDAAAERREADVDDLRAMCLWVDSENADNKTAYKGPHHKAAGSHAVVWRGVAAAMGALMGARDGFDVPDGDRKGIYNHLVKHYKQFDKEPPEFRELAEIPTKEFKTVDEVLIAYAAGAIEKEEASSSLQGMIDAVAEQLEAAKQDLAEMSAKVILRRR